MVARSHRVWIAWGVGDVNCTCSIGERPVLSDRVHHNETYQHTPGHMGARLTEAAIRF